MFLQLKERMAIVIETIQAKKSHQKNSFAI